jgi:signal transduction histidine kinase/ligand-binding sensor domain-containing protein
MAQSGVLSNFWLRPVRIDASVRRLAAFLLGCFLHAAAAPAPLLSDYTHTAWGGLQGAPVDVLKFAQSRDGWLWIATATGLYRYDGVQFERTDSVYGHPLYSSDVLGLMAAKDGALWVGYRFGGVTVLRPGGARTYLEADGLPGGSVFHIEAAPDGTVWVATRDGIASLAPGAGRFVRHERTLGLPANRFFQILFGRDGTQWVAAMDGVFFRRPGARAFAHAWPRMTLMAMAESPDGTLWASDDRNRYYRVQTSAPPGGAPPAPLLHGSGMWFDRDGTMWLAQADAVERNPDLRPARVPAQRLTQRLTQMSGLSGALPQSFFQDREGNIWIGTSAGLDRLRRNRLALLPASVQFDHPGMVRGPDGGVWVGDAFNHVRSASAAGLHETVLKSGFEASHWTPGGVLWIGDARGLWRRAPGGAVTLVAPPGGVPGFDPQAIQQDRRGRLWISFSGRGLFRLADGQWTPEGGLRGFAAPQATAMAMDAQGQVWMGHAHNHVSVVAEEGGRETVRRLDAASGLQLGTLLTLVPDGRDMWAGGERGTMLYRGGRFLALRGAGGESFRGVSGIVRLADGDLWLHGADGIYHIGAAALAQWLRAAPQEMAHEPTHEPAHEVEFERFDALDGLRGHAPQTRPMPSLLQAADGMLWFSTGSAIALLDPARIHRNPLPPPVLIRSVTANGRRHDIQQGEPQSAPAALDLPAGSDSLRVAFTALGLSMPERVRFRYRLDGVDHGWQGPIAWRAISYTNLAPGSYRFEVSAANEDGVWNPQPAVLEIRIAPTFVQTRWFLLMLAAAGALLLYAAYALRIRTLTRRMQARLQGRLEERSRIARSLHDTLLQSVQGLLMSFNAHVHQIPPGSRERANLERTLGLAGRMLVEGRDQIMDLRAAAAPGDMRLALEAFGKELAGYGGNAFALHVAGRPRPLKPHVSDEVYAIGREALFNASRHAHAGKVVLELDYGREAFTLRIRDDGCGLDEAVARSGHRPGHWGLPDMRERAAALGARFDLASRPGEGTLIGVTLPAELAYQFAWRMPGRLLPLWWRRH